MFLSDIWSCVGIQSAKGLSAGRYMEEWRAREEGGDARKEAPKRLKLKRTGGMGSGGRLELTRSPTMRPIVMAPQRKASASVRSLSGKHPVSWPQDRRMRAIPAEC